jgi:adenylyl- and sulfurtransferase ThiI
MKLRQRISKRVKARHLKRTLARMKSEFPEKLDAIALVEGNPAALKQLQSQIVTSVDEDAEDDTPDWLSDRPILKWLWENRSMILSLIIGIVSMMIGGS